MATTPGIRQSFVGGAAGTMAMTAVMYGVAPMMGLHMDIAAMLGSMLGGSWTAGLVMHLMLGIVVFPATFALVVRGLLPGSELTRGLAWGAALWLVAQVVVMPMMGGGVFSSAIGGATAAMGSLMGHLLYGGTFGWLTARA